MVMGNLVVSLTGHFLFVPWSKCFKSFCILNMLLMKTSIESTDCPMQVFELPDNSRKAMHQSILFSSHTVGWVHVEYLDLST